MEPYAERLMSDSIKHNIVCSFQAQVHSRHTSHLKKNNPHHDIILETSTIGSEQQLILNQRTFFEEMLPHSISFYFLADNGIC